jgi:hypothetical protein
MSEKLTLQFWSRRAVNYFSKKQQVIDLAYLVPLNDQDKDL